MIRALAVHISYPDTLTTEWEYEARHHPGHPPRDNQDEPGDKGMREWCAGNCKEFDSGMMAMNLSENNPEDAGVQSPVHFSVFNYSFRDWQIVAIPIAAIVMAELFLYMGEPQTGITLHVIILMGITLSSIWVRESHVSFSLQALMLLPILRLLNISMPVFSETTLYLYIFIYTPLLIPIYFITRHQKITLKQEGFTLDKLYFYIPLALVIGYLIGVAEWYTISAGNLIPDLSLKSILQLSFIMIFFVGFVEELIFRSLLQTRLQASFGMEKGLVLASLLFGMMHSGYGTPYELLLTASAGLILGYMFQKTGSLALVSVTHGSVNVFLFGFMPFLGPGMGLL
jgi:membrane protease YdiL (CAAX protease family)